MNGQYIVFEGIDGCGKTLQAKMLTSRLMSKGINAKYTCEPGGALNTLAAKGLPLRQFILDHSKDCCPEALEMLLQTDRAQHTADVLAQLQKGITVIADRSFITGLAYARAKGHRYDSVLPVVDFVVDVLPDHVVFCDVSVETAFARMNNGEGPKNREELRGREFMSKVRQNFKDILFSPVGREHDVLCQFDQVCTVHRISTEANGVEAASRLVDQCLGL